ncbi:hypothetical protein SEVIR_9G076501v4 [Setaria viridis]|uniref:Uncharacterized protein n=1 Tax=Setaria viridis TaxID=4556 RepID=A0A4V6D0R0_SETVI|nr:uncharacterized protein LOC117836670 [Setaria viridis]TKV91165.1 hypothetical protein SEVIR_9G076501v2 [Setaria viridis]
MAGAVGVSLEAFAKIGRPEEAQAVGVEAGRSHQGDGGVGAVAESGTKGVVVQEKRRRNSGVLSDSDSVVCMLMDRFAPA